MQSRVAYSQYAVYRFYEAFGTASKSKCFVLVDPLEEQLAANPRNEKLRTITMPPEERPVTIPSTETSGITEHSKPKVVASLVTLELCCGSAGLTAHLRRKDFDAVAVDHKHNRHRPKAPVVNLDLTSQTGQEIVMRVIRSGKLFLLTAAPPCGTATAARDKPVPLSLQRKGAPNPPPLRSKEFPKGLPGLSGFNAVKVEQANNIYQFIVACIKACDEHGVYWAVENPRGS